jgi:hypothetical protein
VVCVAAKNNVSVKRRANNEAAGIRRKIVAARKPGFLILMEWQYSSAISKEFIAIDLEKKNTVVSSFISCGKFLNWFERPELVE